MPHPDLSICIVSHNTRDLLRDCLRSLPDACPGLSWEVIVADNGSRDGSVAMLREEFPDVHLIENKENLGYTLPMNQTLRMGQARFLIQLNPDTLVKPGAFLTLAHYMEANPLVGIVTPKVLNRDGSLQKQCRRSAARPWDAFTYMVGLSSLFPRSRLFGRYLLTYLPEDEVSEVEAVSGSCMLMRRTMVEQIGFLDETFFAYQEDADYCFRARKAGWQVFYMPAAQIIHYGGQGGSRVQPYQAIYQWHRSYYLYYRKHLAREYFFVINWLMYAAMAVKLGWSLLVNALRREKVVGSKKP